MTMTMTTTSQSTPASSSSSSSSSHRRTLPSHLLWRSLLGAPAAWSGSSSRGVYLVDSKDFNHVNKEMIQSIPTDGRRMFHLPTSLRDAILGNDLTLPTTLTPSSSGCHSLFDDGITSIAPYNHHRRRHHHHHYHQRHWRDVRINVTESSSSIIKSPNKLSFIRLLSKPRIVGAASPTNTLFHWSQSLLPGRGGMRMCNGGISCMDLDRGNDATSSSRSSPPRYLLVGSGGGDCSIALYDLSVFGSDSYLYHNTCSSSTSLNKKNSIVKSSSSSQTDESSLRNHRPIDQSLWTHRPIARSLKQNIRMSSDDDPENIIVNGIPSGHRHPLRGVHWYPADVNGAFVSASISGEILVWDAQNFVPIFATYSHVYANTSNIVGVMNKSVMLEKGGKSVASIQCTDLPKTPEGCPHGTALLALGLGGGVDGRGVVQLCDAFRGGSATHELIGHSRNGSGDGGVTAVAWDPHHPFRLASGGKDCTIRLWDIRKAGAAACLGVLNRECGTTGGSKVGTSPAQKRQKACISMSTTSHNNIMNSVESHEAPVTAITFAPYGDDLVSASLDGQIKHWDLRPDSCFTSSFAAARDSRGSKSYSFGSARGVDGGGLDPSVAMGGHLLPTLFFSDDRKLFRGNTQKSPSERHQRIRHNRASLAIIQPGSRTTATLISTASNGYSSRGQITGYSLYGRRGKEPGGYPDFVLDGHLADVTCLVPVVGTWDNLAGGRCSGNSTFASNPRVMFLTGGEDGMVLCWGRDDDLRRDESIDDATCYCHGNSYPRRSVEEDVDMW